MLGSKLIIAIGDKINNMAIKVLYYVLLPIPLFWLWVGLITLLLGNYDPQTLGDAVFFSIMHPPSKTSSQLSQPLLR